MQLNPFTFMFGNVSMDGTRVCLVPRKESFRRNYIKASLCYHEFNSVLIVLRPFDQNWARYYILVRIIYRDKFRGTTAVQSHSLN
jgi:hypothetical protein